MFGPRLDRPSAVGDEGRPRETSLGIAAVTVVGLALATGFVVGRPTVLTGFALVAGLATAGVALLDRDTLGEKVVGHLCFLPGATTLGVLVVLFPRGATLLVGGFVLALLGVASSWADVAADEPLESALTQGLLSYVFGLCWLFGTGIALAALFLCWQLATGVTAETDPTAAAVGLLAVVGLVAGAVRVALRALPVVQLTPRDRRQAVRAHLGRAKRALTLTALGGLGLALVSLVFLLTSSPGLGLVPGSRPLLAALSSGFVVGPLLAVAAVAMLFGVVPQLAGLLLVSPTGFAVVVLLAPIGVLVVVGLALVAVRVDLVPDNAGGPALAATGLVVAAVGADSTGLPVPLVFACVAGALVAWDTGSFGLGLTAELGHRPATRRLELYHGVFAVGIGAVAVLAATGLYALRRTALGPAGNVAAMTAAVVGALLLGVLLRG
ncbi:glycosyl transferase [Halobacteriales archaeon QH_8_67_27]|nr:MAG: glycosyl transferase [Halobacteriales archaeon QH_8_67_27]